MSYIKTLVKSNKLQEAKEFFRSLPNPNIEDWNQMLKISKTRIEVDNFFNSMIQNKINPNECTLTYLLNCYLKNNAMEECTNLMIKMEKEFGIKANNVHYSCLLHSYMKIKDIQRVEEIVATMERKNIILDAIGFHVLIRGYINSNRFDQAIKTFAKMKTLHIYPTQQQLSYYKSQHLV